MMGGEDARQFSNYPTNGPLGGPLGGLFNRFPHPVLNMLGAGFGQSTNPIQQFFESQTGQGTPVQYASGHDLEATYQRLLDAGMQPEEAQRLISQVATDKNRGGIPLEAAIQQAMGLETQQKQLGEVNKAEQSIYSQIDPQLQRLGGIVGYKNDALGLNYQADPNAIRTDAEYAPILAGVENQIRGNERQAQRNIQQTQASSGGGALSGIANRQALATQVSGQQGLMNALSGIKSDIRGRLTGLEQWRGDTGAQAANQRTGILGNQPYNALDPWALNSAIWQNRVGQAQQPLQMGINALTGLAGTAGNIANGSASNIMGLASMFGGR